MSEVIDTRWIQVSRSVAVNIHPDLNDAYELHEVCNGLPSRVAARDDRTGRGGVATFSNCANQVVVVLVNAATTRRQRHRRAAGLFDYQCAERTGAISIEADRHRRDPMRGHDGGDLQRLVVLVVRGAVAKDRYGP